jgi:signal transduction histidine kinase
VENRLEGFDAGADDFLAKPVEDWELRARVRTFLQIAAQHRATEESYRKLREAQRLRDELNELIVHDLKNPLASLSFSLGFVESRLAKDPEGREAALDCRASTARLLRMVTVLLDVSRLEEGRLEPALTLQPAKTLLDASARGRHHEATLRSIVIEVVADREQQVRLDADLISRVVDNLLDNALRYTPSRGSIRLSAGPGPLGTRLTIANSGAPIPEKDHERIFTKYERMGESKSPRGSNRGLGLYFCRLATEAHKGRISVDDGGGKGCRFIIDLPL